MFKLIKEVTPAERIVTMKDMKPLEIGHVINSNGEKGGLVMRTASIDKFEVMILSNPEPDGCWSGASTLKVRLLPAGSRVTLEVV